MWGEGTKMLNQRNQMNSLKKKKKLILNKIYRSLREGKGKRIAPPQIASGRTPEKVFEEP